MRSRMRTTWLTAIVTAAVLGGCSDSDPTPSDAAPDTVGPDTVGPGGETRVRLRPLGDRDTFFTELRGALVAQRGTQEIDYSATDGLAPSGEPVTDTAEGGADGTTDGMTDGTTDGMTDGAVGGSGDLDGGATAGDSAEPSGGESEAGDGGRLEVTETNVQEQGVDEQDRVKVSGDGTRLYVLQSGYGDVYPLDPAIVDDLALGESGDLAIDPLPGGPVPEPRTTLRILGLDAAATEATALRDVELDLGGRSAQGMYLHESEAGSRVVLASSGGGFWGVWDDPEAFGGRDSVFTRIDVDDPAGAAISGSFRIDGQIVSSRRIGRHLFFASRYYPVLPGPQPYDLSPERWRAAVEAADDETLLPGYTDESSGTRVPLIDPEGCFVAPRPASDWYSPDIVTLAVIDLDTMELADSECYLGASETLYASPDAVYLATTRWDYGDDGVIIVEQDGGDAGTATGSDTIDENEPVEPVDASETSIAPYDPRIETDIHQFDIDGGTLAYRGSGTVRGHLGFSDLRRPFRMSSRDGYLRVATVNETFDIGIADGRVDGFAGGGTAASGQGNGQSVSPINLTVLRPDGNGDLRRVSELPNAERPNPIGKPGESLYASRFIGDRAYLVTFRQTDPLYVVDLSDPADPAVLGELEIEGFSDYLLPIDEEHLLGIGRDAVAPPGGEGDERGGLVQGIKLSLFDVGDPSAPREVESLVVGQRGTEANALYDHRGITVQRATDEHPTRVSFGIDVAGETFPERRPRPVEAFDFYGWRYTGLHGFDVTGGDGADIEYRGAMVVERLGDDGRRYGPSAYEDRAVMVNDTTYYVHGAEVWIAPWDDLGNPAGPR